jgi:hypothetical protein
MEENFLLIISVLKWEEANIAFALLSFVPMFPKKIPKNYNRIYILAHYFSLVNVGMTFVMLQKIHTYIWGCLWPKRSP